MSGGHDATYARDFRALVRGWGLTHFRAEELLYPGAANGEPGHAAFNLNTLPPRALWPNIEAAAKAADAARALLRAPLRVLSAFRSEAYNAAVGGKPGSLHRGFRALDLAPPERGDVGRLYGLFWILRKKGMPGCRGIGRYAAFIHIDNGPKRDW